MGPMVDQIKERVEQFKKIHEDQTRDPGELRLDKFSPFAFTRDNRWIEVDPFPRPFSLPIPWSPSQRPKFLNASAQLPDDNGSQPENSAPAGYPRPSAGVLDTDLARNDLRNQPANSVQTAVPLGIYSGEPMRQRTVAPPIWGIR